MLAEDVARVVIDVKMDCSKMNAPKIDDIVIVKIIKIYLDGFCLLELQGIPKECGTWEGILMLNNKRINILNECVKVKIVRLDNERKYFDAIIV